MDLTKKKACPLCKHHQTETFFQDRFRFYWQCPVCCLIFVSREYLLSPEQEKARYDLHQNDPQDAGYRQFLQKFITPLCQRLGPAPLNGLDFGSGPTHALALMLEEQGYTLKIFDPFYTPNVSVLQNQYDFITCTETFEHFHQPQREWNVLINLLKPGGLLGIMTLLIDNPDSLQNSHYITDMTHVSFFSRQTFRFLARGYGLSVEFLGDKIIFIRKPERQTSR